MSEALRYAIRGPFQTKPTPLSPAVDDDRPGLRIAAVDLAREGDAIRFTLLVSYGFADGYFFAFKDLRRAVVVELQDAASGRVAAFSLVDPSINEFEPIIENFSAPDGSGPGVAFMRGWTGVPIEVALPEGGDGLFVRASIQSHVSNLLRVPT